MQLYVNEKKKYISWQTAPFYTALILIKQEFCFSAPIFMDSLEAIA